MKKQKPRTLSTSGETLKFETGSISKDEIEAIFDTIPLDITYIDKNDDIKYYNRSSEIIFNRSKSLLGSKVQLCHPKKSIPLVDELLNNFKNRKEDLTEFWVQKDGRLIHIRYFAIRDREGKYLGTMEVAQDITKIEEKKDKKGYA